MPEKPAIEDEDGEVPRYLVERTFPDGLEIAHDEVGARMVTEIVTNNFEQNVTWVWSFLTDDRTKSFCIYDGPSPESIRRAATANGLPVDIISEVTVLDPYFYDTPHLPDGMPG